MCDISQRTKAEALAALAHKMDEGKLSKREALAIKLIDRMVEDPHTVTHGFFAELRQVFNEDELIELVFAGRSLSGGIISTSRCGSTRTRRARTRTTFATLRRRLADHAGGHHGHRVGLGARGVYSRSYVNCDDALQRLERELHEAVPSWRLIL